MANFFVTPAKCDLCAHYGDLIDKGDWFVCKDTKGCHTRDAQNKVRRELLKKLIVKEREVQSPQAQTILLKPALIPLIWFNDPEMVWKGLVDGSEYD